MNIHDRDLRIARLARGEFTMTDALDGVDLDTADGWSIFAAAHLLEGKDAATFVGGQIWPFHGLLRLLGQVAAMASFDPDIIEAWKADMSDDDLLADILARQAASA